jgi:AhpD family alkylhydroperoxidase
MPSTFRIPKATVTGLYGRVLTAYARRTWGQVPDNAYVLWHHKRVLKAVLGFEQKVAKWDRLDPHLKSYAQLASAGVIGCSWCLDFGYFLAHDEGLDLAKVREVPRWRESEVFTPLERDVLEYAEAMSTTPLTVTDEMVQRLLDQLGPEAVVELTQLVALENMRSRFNSAAGLQAQGYSDVCELPLAMVSTSSTGSSTGSPTGRG